MKKYLAAAALIAALTEPASAVAFPSLTTIYIGSGVRDNVGSNTIATAFLCTDVSGVTADVRVQVLFSTGVVAGNSVGSVPHGGPARSSRTRSEA